MSDFRKSITFQAKLEMDPNAFAENLKKQFENASATLNTSRMQGQTAARASQMGFGGMSVPKSEDIQKSRRELAQFIREQQNEQEKLYKLITNQKDTVDKMRTAKRDMLKDSKEELKIHEQMLTNLNAQYREKDRIIQKGLNVFGGGSGGSGGGGGGNNLLSGADWSGVTPGGGPKMSPTALLKGFGAFSGALLGVSRAIDSLAGFPMRLEEAKGVATQSFLGRDIQAIQSGASAFETPWMTERAKAAEMAKDKRWWNRITDTAAGLGGAALVGGGAATAALTGWTGVGLAAGAGMMTAGGGILANDRYRSAINPFGQDEYQKLLDAQQGTDMLSTWEAMKQQDPKKRAAIERLQGRYQGDLATQRMMGLGYQGFAGAGGFQERANMAGFTGDMAAAMAAQIQGAGGSTRGMRELSTLGLQAQRGFDLTNAGSVLGRISGGAGGGAASEQIFRRLMEESIKAGLDKSDFREEQRRFADVTSEILSRAGVQTAAEAEKALQGFSRFLGENTTVRGIEGAKAAYEEAQGFSAETSGRGGALQFAGVMQDSILRKLGSRGAAGAMEMPLEDINPSNSFIIAEAAKIGVSPEVLADRLKKMKTSQSYVAIGLNESKVGRMDRAMTELGITGVASSAQLEQLKDKYPEAFQTYSETMEAVTMRNKYAGPQKREADFLGLRRGLGAAGTEPSAFGPSLYEEALGKATGRPEDEAVRATGLAAQAMLENFRNFKDEIVPATKAFEDFIKAVMSFNTAVNANSKDSLSRYLNNVPRTLNQVQGGKPK